MEKKPPIIAVILTILSMVQPTLSLFFAYIWSLDATKGFLFYALSPIVNWVAIALAIISIIICQRSVKRNGQYLSAYILLVVNCASVIINLALIPLNYFERFPRFMY